MEIVKGGSSGGKNFDISAWLEKQGFGIVPPEQREKIDVWLDWYKGYVEDFHKYRLYNRVCTVTRRMLSMQMAKFVSEDWANLLLNERVKINVRRPEFQERLDYVLASANWYKEANALVELTFALGTGAFCEYMDGDEIRIDYIRADMIYPLSWDGHRVKECAFGSWKRIDGKDVVYLMLHRLSDSGTYIIENHLFDPQTSNEIPLPPEVAPFVDTQKDVPLFQVFTPAIINNVDLDSPMGISIFGNSIPTLQALDIVYDSMSIEFLNGKKRIIVPASMTKIDTTQVDENGKPLYKPIFDYNDTVFYAFETDGDEDKMPFEISGNLRIAEHAEGLKANLAILGKKVGVGCDRYLWDKSGGVKTATEVVSDKSDLYQNLRKHEHPLESAIKGMVQAIASLSGVTDDPETTIIFDDSIITDAEHDKQDALTEVGAGLRSKISYLMDVRGLSEADARAELQSIADEQRASLGLADRFQSGSGETLDGFDDDDPAGADDA